MELIIDCSIDCKQFLKNVLIFSYCLVTFKAAVHFLMNTDFSDIEEILSTVQQTTTPVKKSLKVQAPASPISPQRSPNLDRSPMFDRSHASRNSKNRFEQQMDEINKLVEDSTVGLGTQTKKTPKPVKSVFGGK